MTPRRSNPGSWLSSGMSLRSVGRPQGSRLHRRAGLDRGFLRLVAAGPRSRLALAAALVVASLLSPGASGACAGCCDDGPPSVVAPLAAGIAPVHSAAVVDAASHRCCHTAGIDAVAVAEACCPVATIESVGCEAPSEQAEPCGCDVGPRDEAPAIPVRSQADDLRIPAPAFGHGFHTTAPDAGRMLAAVDGTPLQVHPRPLRVLFGVWRN